MTEKIYKVRCVDGKLYLVHHGVSDFIGLNDWCTNEKAIIQISHYLNEQEETIQKQNQEIITCHDTLTTIHELCNAVLNYDFKNVNDKVDFCHMLNEMDNKDLMFLKECFEAIRDNDLKTMTSLTVECNGDVEWLRKQK